MALAVLYNGVAFSPVNARQSIVLPYTAEILWDVVGKWSKQASWMGSVEGQPIYTQLLGNETDDRIGVARAFGIGDKVLVEQLTRLDPTEMVVGWQLMSHPLNSNPWPSSFLNFKSAVQVFPVLIPGGQAFVNWHMELMTEQHAVGAMKRSMEDIMRLGLANLERYLAAGLRQPVTAPMAPAVFQIGQMTQPEGLAVPPTMMPGMGHLQVLPQEPIFCPPPGQPQFGALPSSNSNGNLMPPASSAAMMMQHQQYQHAQHPQQHQYAQMSQAQAQMQMQQLQRLSGGSERRMMLNPSRSPNTSGGSAVDVLVSEAGHGMRHQLSHNKLPDMSKSN